MLCKYLEQREADVKRRKVIPENNDFESDQYNMCENYIQSIVVLPSIDRNCKEVNNKHMYTIAVKGCKSATVKSSSFSLAPIKNTESNHRDTPFFPGKSDIVEDDKSGIESPYNEYMQQRSLKLHRSPSQAEVNLFFDGGARPNPGPIGGAGYALFE